MKNMNIGIDMGSRVAIVGPNGAGVWVGGTGGRTSLQGSSYVA